MGNIVRLNVEKKALHLLPLEESSCLYWDVLCETSELAEFFLLSSSRTRKESLITLETKPFLPTWAEGTKEKEKRLVKIYFKKTSFITLCSL